MVQTESPSGGLFAKEDKILFTVLMPFRRAGSEGFGSHRWLTGDTTMGGERKLIGWADGFALLWAVPVLGGRFGH